MKKLFITAIVLLTLTLTPSAANGDVVGKIYSTDIRAFINGVEVQSYNIGGKTAVVIEDIIKESSRQYSYNNDYRALKFYSLNPDYLVEGKNESTKKPGTIVGKIYETDIKTSIYDIVLPTYNIGGKTAVAIEDLGYDGAFSPIGGKFIWDNESRTISLDFLYNNSNVIPNDKVIKITANKDMTEANAVFEEVLHCGGGTEHFNWPDHITDDSNIEVILPVKAQEKVIGYYFRRPNKDYKFTAFTYYYPDRVKEAAKIYTPISVKSREDIIQHYGTQHAIGEPIERFDTEDYSFVYMCMAFTSGSSNYLVQVYDDGTYVDYLAGIHNTKRSVRDLQIDKENEKITFKYVDRYTAEWFTNYEIDLKAGTMKEI